MAEFKPLVNKDSAELNRKLRIKIYTAMAKVLEDTERSEEERIAASRAYSDVLYWMVLLEEGIHD